MANEQNAPAGALTNEQIDHALDAVLRASGSNLRNYTMPETLGKMRAAVRAIERAAIEAYQRQQWRPIDTAPHETLVVLGWRDESGVFKQEIALASAGKRYPGGASDMWSHGRATHWMPLPPPPEAES